MPIQDLRAFALTRITKSSPRICDECFEIRMVHKSIEIATCNTCGAPMRFLTPGYYERCFDKRISYFDRLVLEFAGDNYLVRVSYRVNAFNNLDPQVICDIDKFFGFMEWDGQRVLRYERIADHAAAARRTALMSSIKMKLILQK